jgi:hypothetical protein
MKKMKTEDILKKIEELEEFYEIRDFIHSLDLTKEQFEILAENEDRGVRQAIAEHSDLPNALVYKLAEDKDQHNSVRRAIAFLSDLPDDLIIRLSCDSDCVNISIKGFEKLKNLSNLKSEDLEKAYDLIRTSKIIGRENFEKTFDYIISNFPELSEAAKLFKSIILKGKKDLI